MLLIVKGTARAQSSFHTHSEQSFTACSYFPPGPHTRAHLGRLDVHPLQVVPGGGVPLDRLGQLAEEVSQGDALVGLLAPNRYHVSVCLHQEKNCIQEKEINLHLENWQQDPQVEGLGRRFWSTMGKCRGLISPKLIPRVYAEHSFLSLAVPVSQPALNSARPGSQTESPQTGRSAL